MVRSDQQLVERMTLVWHSWFATSIDGATASLMLRQNRMMRARALGNFHDLLGGGHARPGDAPLALGHREQQVQPERELRPRR